VVEAGALVVEAGALVVEAGALTVGDAGLASCKFLVTKTDMQIKPEMNIAPVIGLSHITVFPVNPRNLVSFRSPAQYFL
jgi:hypothetical protein